MHSLAQMEPQRCVYGYAMFSKGAVLRGVIRVGDSTSHGGKVVTGRDGSTVMGRAVACVGDKCTCPKSGHNNCVIIEGDETVRVDGRAVAFDGHKTSCGAALISSTAMSGLA
jgi:uncharacterized Zn-binding protein involved in type VI secretion